MNGLADPSHGPQGPPTLDARRRLLALLNQYPGLQASELARRVGIEENLARYHLHVLVRSGLATEIREEQEIRFYPLVPTIAGAQPSIGRVDRPALAALRRPKPLEAVLVLLEEPQHRCSMADLSRRIGVSPSTGTYHVGRLRRAGLVDVEPQHRERWVLLHQPERVLRLLRDFPPPQDLVQGFIELWDRLDL